MDSRSGRQLYSDGRSVASFARQLTRHIGVIVHDSTATTDIQFENARHHHHCLRAASILEHGETKRVPSIDE